MFAELSKRFPSHNRPFCLLSHPDCLLHDPGLGHPENIQRLTAILRGLLELDSHVPLDMHIPAPAKISELSTVHSLNYLMYLEETCLKSESHFMSSDNSISELSLRSILASGGMALAAGAKLSKGGSCFCLTRPPGHHAGKEKAEGFCFINHVALAIEKIRIKHPFARFLIVDFDVHHGNGIDSIFREDERVFYFSLHGSPAHIYPGTGWEHEKGGGKNPESRLNITLDLHTSGEIWIEKFNTYLALAA
jgi:acetoin utilization deacetylase AcuC-like enzyme